MPLAVHNQSFCNVPVRIAPDPAALPLAVHVRSFRDGPACKAHDPAALTLAVLKKSGARCPFVLPPDPGQRSLTVREILGTRAAPCHALVRLKMAIPDEAAGLASQFHPACCALRLACTCGGRTAAHRRVLRRSRRRGQPKAEQEDGSKPGAPGCWLVLVFTVIHGLLSFDESPDRSSRANCARSRKRSIAAVRHFADHSPHAT